ncbi:hypothetical protein [Ponticaulis koreensis]|uniref:hypothetical protein n=1 Tax=Ponticaulis koreensis TaxID=1123045 RepID=UPI0003B5E492|nr:hypothetical protein [Ponticaulis koreensis]
MIGTTEAALSAIEKAWPMVEEECSSVLGAELHYQAMIYHALRMAGGVPRGQLGMNVKQWISDPVSKLFREFDLSKHEKYRGGFEPIPDIVIFSPEIEGDWRRRNREKTLEHMLVAIEVKASEREGGRLSPSEISKDILKLSAHREEVQHRGYDFVPVMMVIDTAPKVSERMTSRSVSVSRAFCEQHSVIWKYMSA